MAKKFYMVYGVYGDLLSNSLGEDKFPTQAEAEKLAREEAKGLDADESIKVVCVVSDFSIDSPPVKKTTYT